MFRPMRRIKQQLPDEEALAVLKNAKRGVLSVTGDDGWPYGVWLNPYYREADGRIYFHGAKEGHKVDALRKDSRASFTVIDEGVKDEGGWAYSFRSVVVFGRIEFVEDHSFALELCRELARRFNPSEEEIEKELQMYGAHVQMMALIPEHITGKRIHEA